MKHALIIGFCCVATLEKNVSFRNFEPTTVGPLWAACRHPSRRLGLEFAATLLPNRRKEALSPC